MYRSNHVIAALVVTLSFIAIISPGASAKAVPGTIGVIDSVLSDTTKLKGKVVYVDFWASWCVPCQKSFPWMKELEDRYHRRGLEIVAVNLDPTTAPAKAFLDRFGSPLDILSDTARSWQKLRNGVVFDSTGVVADRYGLKAMPSTFVYGRDGSLRKTHQGFEPKDTLFLDSVVNSLIGEDKSK